MNSNIQQSILTLKWKHSSIISHFKQEQTFNIKNHNTKRPHITSIRLTSTRAIITSNHPHITSKRQIYIGNDVVLDPNAFICIWSLEILRGSRPPASNWRRSGPTASFNPFASTPRALTTIPRLSLSLFRVFVVLWLFGVKLSLVLARICICSEPRLAQRWGYWERGNMTVWGSGKFLATKGERWKSS